MSMLHRWQIYMYINLGDKQESKPNIRQVILRRVHNFIVEIIDNKLG